MRAKKVEKIADKPADKAREERDKLRAEERARAAAEKSMRDRLRAEQKAKRDAERKIEQKRKAEVRKKRRKARLAFYAEVRKKISNDPRGFDYENVGFLPRVEVSATGDGAALARACAENGIKLTDFEADGSKLRFKIRKKDMRKAIALSDGMCYNYSVGKSYGIGAAAAFWLARIGLCIGAVAAVVGIVLSYSYVWRIDISGNDKLSKAAIESALVSAGYGRMPKKSVDCGAVAAAVGRLEGVADASAELRGTTLCVYVLEAEDFVSAETYSAYESGYDAAVTRVVVRSGSAKVKSGDIVAKGELLCDGGIYSTTGELIGTGECDAEVYGTVSEVFTANVGSTAVEYRRTGNSCVRTGYTLFGHSFGKTSSPYASYESEVTTASYDVLVPLYVTSYRYYETEPVTFERDIDAAVQSFASQKIADMRFSGDFRSSYTVTPTAAGLYTVHVFLSGEVLISKGITR